MNEPLISICIPTYNRAAYLEKTLASIVSQPAFQSKLAEVVISDNASTDNTQEVAGAYARRYDNIRYFRNEENVRDENFPLALSRARGILRKLNNDTLLLRPDALENLCALAQKYRQDRPSIYLSNRPGDAERCLNFRDFAVSEGHRVTWLGSFTIWDHECENIQEDLYGCSLSLWQVRKFYENACKKDAVVVCGGVFGEAQSVANKDLSYGLYNVFYRNYMTLLDPYVQRGALDGTDREKIEKDLLYQFFTHWLVRWELSRSQCQYCEAENLKDCVFKQYENKPYWPDYLQYYKKQLLIGRVKTFARRILKGR